MNGLQSVTISLCKRIRCPPTCPRGTRGRTISRRLTRALTTATGAEEDPLPSLPISQLHTHLDPDSIRCISRETTDAVKRLKSVLDYVVQEFETSRLRSSGPEASSSTVSLVKPLDASLTGLDPIPSPSPQSPLGGLLRAIDQKKGVEIWDRFMQTYVNFLLTRSIKGNHFSALLLSLKADDYLDLKERHRLAANGRTYYVISEEQAFAEFKRKLVTVVKAMQKAGYRLTVREYGHLIDCARAGADPKMAEEYWSAMCSRGSHMIDTWAYNSFMAAVSGGAAYEREFAVNEKSVGNRSMRKDGYVTRAKRIFRRMLDKGISPNSMTFDILMLAMARMGDLKDVSRTLKEIWGVDVDELPNEDAVRDRENRITIRPDSPLYPTGHTLLAVAAAFCQNGSVDKAIRTVDHISRLYNIPIPVPAWVTLLNWTYVYTRQRTGHERSLPASALEGLWKIMTGEPYNVKPTADMYDYIIRSYLWRRKPGMAEQMMDAAMTSLVRPMIWRARRIEARMAYGRIIRGPEDINESMERKTSYTADEVASLRKQVASMVRDEHRLRSMFRRWTELMVVGKDLELTAFGTQEVPRIIEKWECFLGREVVYVLRSGHVELDLGRESAGELWKPITTRKRRWMYMALGTGAKEEDDFF